MAGLDMNKTIWIVANWKSNKNIKDALEWISQVGPQLPRKDNLKVVVCPTFSTLSEVKKAIKVGNFPLTLGSQDLSPFDKGAYTGEESAILIKDLIGFTILGHSERRKNFGETDNMVAQKASRARENNITALVCVQDEQTPVPEGCHLIAYEPVWAIGTGKADNPENAQKLASAFKQKFSSIEIIYGGSVMAANVKEFITQPDISGILVGNASLDPQEFIKICNASLEK